MEGFAKRVKMRKCDGVVEEDKEKKRIEGVSLWETKEKEKKQQKS